MKEILKRVIKIVITIKSKQKMTTLKLEDSKARELHSKATAELKQILEDSFPKGFFSQKITDRIKGWEDLCKEKGLHPVNDLPFPAPKNDHQEGVNAFHVCTMAREVLNEGFRSDFGKTVRYMLYPDVIADSSRPSGFRLSFRVLTYTFADTFAGARLEFVSRNIAKHFFDCFLEHYEKMMLINYNKQ